MSQSQPQLSLNSLVSVLDGVGVPSNVEDLADIFWLAEKIESPSIEKEEVEPSDSETTDTEETEPSKLDIPIQPSRKEQRDKDPSIATPRPPEAAIGTEGLPIQVPAARSLRSRLNLSRSLRPLMRKIPSPTVRVFDEDATIKLYAEQQILSPVLSPAPERWLDLALVVEEHPSTFLWEETILELLQILERQGAFRQINTWQIEYQSGDIHLARYSSELTQSCNPSRKPEVLNDPSGRQIIWLVSDCSSQLWYQPQFYEWLKQWGKQSPIAILQLLPPRLWTQNALGKGLPVNLNAQSARTANSRLNVERYIPQIPVVVNLTPPTAHPTPQPSKPQSIIFPVITLEPEPLLQLTLVTAGKGGEQVRGIELVPEKLSQSKPISDEGVTQTESLNYEDLFRNFQTNASPLARKLAGMMASVPVSLPVVQLIREKLLPGSRQVHIAEVYMSGLLERQKSTEAEQSDTFKKQDPQYEFVDGIRPMLRKTVFKERTEAVLDAVSAYICDRLGVSTRSFEALIAEMPDLTEDQQATVLPFAHIAIQSLRDMGGYYQYIADQLDPAFEIVPPTPTKNPFSNLQELRFTTGFLRVSAPTSFPPPLEIEEFDVASLELVPHIESRTEPFTFRVITWKQVKGEWLQDPRNQTAYLYREQLPGELLLEMVSIPEGTFDMGSTNDEEGRYSDESPVHEVNLPSFFLGRYPITQAQWQIVANLSKVDRDLTPKPSYFDGDLHPVEQVSWLDANEFCLRLSRYTGRDYRLPSEAEWEYACRAGTTTAFHFGDMITVEVANFNGVSYSDGPEGKGKQVTTPVDYFDHANDFGLSDMHGNVLEWCQDTWHEDYEGAPTDGEAWVTEKIDEDRVWRGGSWGDSPRNCRSASRYRLNPDDSDNILGFRVACSAPRT